MPTIQKTPGGSIRIQVDFKNTSSVTADIWAGASIYTGDINNPNIVQNIPQNHVPVSAGGAGRIILNDVLQPYLSGTYKLFIALWNKDPATPGITLDDQLDNEEWTLVIAPTKITATIVSITVT